MLYIFYRPSISLEDKDERNIFISKELNDFLLNHKRYIDNFLDDYYDDNFFSIDIYPEDIIILEKLCKNEDEIKLLNDIKKMNISYLNIEPHTIIGK